MRVQHGVVNQNPSYQTVADHVLDLEGVAMVRGQPPEAVEVHQIPVADHAGEVDQAGDGGIGLTPETNQRILFVFLQSFI